MLITTRNHIKQISQTDLRLMGFIKKSIVLEVNIYYLLSLMKWTLIAIFMKSTKG